MRTDNVSKVTLSIQNSLGIIMCKFHAVQSKTEGMAASVRVFLNTPRTCKLLIFYFYCIMILLFYRLEFFTEFTSVICMSSLNYLVGAFLQPRLSKCLLSQRN